MPKNNTKKNYKFPRKYTRKHCLAKSCEQMGFTERASCRPYKNCYRIHGGKNTPSNSKTAKKSSGTVHSSKNNTKHPSFVYHSENFSYTSHPSKNTPFAKRTIVNIKNGEGHKKFETFNEKGKTMNIKKQKLTSNEINELTQGNYVPGLWLGV